MDCRTETLWKVCWQYRNIVAQITQLAEVCIATLKVMDLIHGLGSYVLCGKNTIYLCFKYSTGCDQGTWLGCTDIYPHILALTDSIRDHQSTVINISLKTLFHNWPWTSWYKCNRVQFCDFWLFFVLFFFNLSVISLFFFFSGFFFVFFFNLLVKGDNLGYDLFCCCCFP